MSFALTQLAASGLVPGLPRIGARRAPWLPSDLFALSQPGIWLDGSDNSVMWQDAAGTTPVTALGQPVGLILDKRLWGGKTYAQVMAGQPELNANTGNPYTVTTGYTPRATSGGGSGTFEILDGRLRLTADDTFGWKHIEFALPTTAGKAYRVRFRGISTGVISNSGARNWTGVAESPSISMLSVGTHEVTIVATGSSALLRFYIRAAGSSGVGEYVELEYLRIDEIPGKHAYQITAGARPLWQEDANGKPGLQFDGVDDFLVTPSIDFSASDKMLASAGVRKLSDAAASIVAELSAAISANNGSMFLAAPPNAASPSFGFASKGTNTVGASQANVAFAAPVSSVLTGLGDIGADIARLRVNGAQVAENTGDQGTGNYGNYPLFIGMRGGSSLPFNGFIHQLVVRGGALPSAAEIAQLEAFIAGKSGVAR